MNSSKTPYISGITQNYGSLLDKDYELHHRYDLN